MIFGQSGIFLHRVFSHATGTASSSTMSVSPTFLPFTDRTPHFRPWLHVPFLKFFAEHEHGISLRSMGPSRSKSLSRCFDIAPISFSSAETFRQGTLVVSG